MKIKWKIYFFVQLKYCFEQWKLAYEKLDEYILFFVNENILLLVYENKHF